MTWGLGARATEALRRQGIHTMEDLTSKTEAELLRGPDIGRKTLNEITEWLASVGASLKSESA